MNLLITILIVYGISAIIAISKIFEPLRDVAEKYSPNFWKYLTSCMQCLPFWVGVFVSFINGTPFEIMNNDLPAPINVFFTYLFSGGMFSGTTLLIHTIFVKIKGEHSNEMQEKEKVRKIRKGIISES